MKNWILIGAFIIGNIFAVTSQSTHDKRVPNKEVAAENSDALLQEVILNQEMAAVAAGFSQDGKILWQGASGYADISTKRKADPDMLHRVASITKPMTAIAIMQLWEQGKLGLDDPVNKYLSYFPVHKKGIITIRHLLNQSSGIKAYKNSKEGFPTTNYPNLKAAISVFKNRKLAFAPGTAYQYTTYGYVVLGAVIEEVSGLSYRDYMKQNVWIPANMPSTDVEIFGKTYTNKAALYRLHEDGQIKADIQTNLSVKVPGGGIHSTVNDLLNFGHAILNHTLIKESTFKLMLVDIGHKKQGNPYGFGWFIYGKEGHRSGRIIGHSGAQSGTSSQLMIFLDRKAVEVIISNTNGSYNYLMRLFDRLAGNYLNWTQFKKSTARTLLQVMDKQGFEKGLSWMQSVKDDEEYDLNENEMNALGYLLLRQKKSKEALEIFKLNVKHFPESWNAYDSLGETYLEMGDKSNAKKNYTRSVELNPENEAGMKVLKKL